MSAPFVAGWRENFDRWSWVHFFGPMVLAFFVGRNAAFLCAVAWELLDMAYFYGRPTIQWRLFKAGLSYDEAGAVVKWIDRRIFDPRGFSYGDVLCGAGGAAIGGAFA